MRKIFIKLKNSNDPDKIKVFSGYYIVASFVMRTIDGLTSSGLKIDLDNEGNGIMNLPANNSIEHDLIHFEFFGAGGFWVSEKMSLGESVFNEKYDAKNPFIFNVPIIETYEYNKSTYRISGRLIDISAKTKISKLTFYIVASESEELVESNYKILNVVSTDFDGYFKVDIDYQKKVDNSTTKKYFYAIIPQSEEKIILLKQSYNSTEEINLIEDRQIIGITPLEHFDQGNNKLENSEDCSCEDTPRLPSSFEFAKLDGAFSQDLGVGCMEFTKPNRVIEEYEFYHIVRTTDPSIRKVTINTHTFKEILNQLEKNLLTEDIKRSKNSINRKLPPKLGEPNKDYFTRKKA